jgi:hypothetical protein
MLLLISSALRACFDMREVLGGFSKATSCELWQERYNSQDADFGTSQRQPI